MQEELTNPHYNKIWRKVIMNRHPRSKTLDEALEIELLINGGSYKYFTKYFTSYLSYNYSPPDLEYKDYEGYTTNIRKCEKYNAYICKDIDAVYFLDEDFDEEHSLYYKEILGEDYVLLDNLAPNISLITLEDIILIFPTHSMHFIKRENNLLVIKFFGKNEKEDDFIKYLISWQLTKPLNEQNPETWEKIANLI
jgi:hypothetical protein